MSWYNDPQLAAVNEVVHTWHAESSDPCMREWFYSGHVLVVADYAACIAVREGINPRIPVLASLLHDCARTMGITDEPMLTDQSEAMVRQVLSQTSLETTDIDHICQVMQVHSCRGTVRPNTPAGRVMTTADAMAHLMTDFYFILPFKGWLTAADDFSGYKGWVREKTQRDFQNKIAFEPERQLARPRLEAFQLLFTDASSNP